MNVHFVVEQLLKQKICKYTYYTSNVPILEVTCVLQSSLEGNLFYVT